MSDAFAYLSVLLSIIIGLAIAEILQGYGTLLLSRAAVKLYPPPLIWSVMMLVLATHFWWASFGLAGRQSWSFAAFSAVLLQTVMLFMGSALILPKGRPIEGVDLRAHYLSRAGALFLLRPAVHRGRVSEAVAARRPAEAADAALLRFLQHDDADRPDFPPAAGARDHRARDGCRHRHLHRDHVRAPEVGSLTQGALGPERRGRRAGIVGPRMLRVTAAHLLRHVAPAAGPEARQVLGRLDRPSGGRGDREDQRHLPIDEHRVRGKPEQSLCTDLDRRPRLRRIIDRVAALGRTDELR